MTTNKKENQIQKAMKVAFPYTIPIMTGFLFFGLAYGIFMNAKGYSFWYPLLTSIFIYAGASEFVVGSLFSLTFHPIQTFIAVFLVNARHLFYGLAMLKKYQAKGLKKFYLIFAMCDESFAINCSADIPEDVDPSWFMFFVNLYNQIYWVVSVTLGAILGSFIHIDTKGIEFVMTAMFVVIFMEQWRKEKNHLSSVMGILVTGIALVILGPDHFLIPAMVGILIILTPFHKFFEKELIS